jgi:ABC-type sugar transport system ATPase subunit
MDQQPIVRMEGISKHFPGVQALDNVDFEVYPGEILGFLGENGAGKSTLVKILSGVYSKDQGSIWFKGQPVEIHSPHEAQEVGITTIYQELALVPYLDVAEKSSSTASRASRYSAWRTSHGEAGRSDSQVWGEIPGIRSSLIAAQQMVETRALSATPA